MRTPASDASLVGVSADSRSARMRHALQLVRLYAPFHRPVLLCGPVGAGKTWLAEQLHHRSGRSGPLVVVPAGELTETLYSDTLFGHVTGAYTGATATREGVVERAKGGTLLLDDLAVMPIPAQASLLRVLETGRFRPLGSSVDRPTSARFVFATTMDLQDLVSRGALLPDLESRVGELIVHVPALAERVEDIIPLARGMATRFLTEHGRSGQVGFSDECIELLQGYPWPANIRELQAVVERGIIHAGPSNATVVLRPGHLPDRFHKSFDDTDTSSRLTRSLVESVVREAQGNRSEAARRLGVHRNTITRHLKTAG